MCPISTAPHRAAEPSLSTSALRAKINALRDELVENAFRLDRSGRLDGAEVALALVERLAEWDAELNSACPSALQP